MDLTDQKGAKRVAGANWLVREAGAYFPGVYEKAVHIVRAHILTDTKAIRILATHDFVDVYDHKRKAGEEWLVTIDETETHILDVHEEFVSNVELIVLTSRQFCYVVNPANEDGLVEFGKKELRKGESHFFLIPGEELEGEIKTVYVLNEHQSLLLRTTEEYTLAGEEYKAGQSFVINGPCEFIPETHIEVVEERTTIPLTDNEGIYVQNIFSGIVKLVKGPQTYSLGADEKLWEKHLDPKIEKLLKQSYVDAKRSKKGNMAYKEEDYHIEDRSKVITYKASLNTAVQLYNYQTNESRVIWGPNLAMLEPHEDITLLKLSGDQPKRENVIKSLALELGPTTMSDQLIVETSDHAKLTLSVCYKWYFDVNRQEPTDEEGNKMFMVSDFVGYVCRTLASRIRGVASSISYKDFNENYQAIVNNVIFKKDKDGVKIPFRFDVNNLVIDDVNCDQGLKPVDPEIERCLQKSLSLSFQIENDSKQLQAKYDADKMKQEKEGELQRDRLKNEIEHERQRISLEKDKSETRSV